MLKMTAF